MDLEPRLLRYFLAVAEELHFGRAAARLYISQPSLSSQIHKLERTLGTDLFVRTSRQVELTPAGRALLEEAPLALGALERAAERARLAGAGIAGTVRLGYAPMAGYETLGAILTAVEHDSPNVTVIASELFSAEMPARVLAGELDIGLALFPEAMRGVRSEPLRMEPLALLAGKHHRLADADSIPLATSRTKCCCCSRASSPPATTTASSLPASSPASSPGSEPSPTRLPKRWSPAYWRHARLAYRLPHSPSTPPRPSPASSLARSSSQRSR
jgi:DNA-binding transcriptional LysR family regulator